MKQLTKDSSKRPNCDSQKDTEDFSNVITDTDSVVAINNCFIISVTDMVHHVNSLFSDKTVSYMNNKRYYFGLNKKNRQFMY